MLTIVLGLVAALGWGLHDFVVQPVTRRASPTVALFWVAMMSAALLMVMSLVTEGTPDGSAEWRSVGVAAVGGVLYVAAILTLFRALSVGYLSLVTPLVALGGGVGALLALVLGERLLVSSLVALPLAIVGARLVSIVPRKAAPGSSPVPPVSSTVDASGGCASISRGSENGGPSTPGPQGTAHYQGRTAAGVGWALLAALLYGITMVVYSYVDGISAITAAAWGRLTGFAVVVPFVVVFACVRVPRRLVVRAGAAAVLDSVAYVAIAQALVLGPVAVASALSSQFATIALLLGVIVLHERPSRTQLAGLACTVVAVLVFSLGV